MKTRIVLLAGALAVGACDTDLTVPNLNDPSAGQDATRSSIATNAQGLLSSARGMSTQGVRFLGIWGRESYDLRQEEPRPYTDHLVGPRDPNSFNAGSFFGTNYTAIANVHTLLDALEGVETLTDAEKEAVRGWAKTVEAFAYFQIAVMHPEFGAPLEPPESPTGELAPVASQDELYQRALALFDDAKAHLEAGGSEFPFAFTEGYAPFDATPAAFIQVNRALKARTLKYMGQWSEVLATLAESFIDENADMSLGVYHSYSLTDGTNPYFNTTTDYIHPRILADAQSKSGGDPDDRAAEKTAVLDEPVTLYDITVTEVPAMYPAATSPFPWIKNEELLLIRAEANLALNGPAAALADVNVVREESGGLDPLAGAPGAEAMLDEILYNKRYSLLWEGGFTYLDAFQYDRLGALPRALPDHVVFARLNWPANECLARGMTDGPCGSFAGIP